MGQFGYLGTKKVWFKPKMGFKSVETNFFNTTERYPKVPLTLRHALRAGGVNLLQSWEMGNKLRTPFSTLQRKMRLQSVILPIVVLEKHSFRFNATPFSTLQAGICVYPCADIAENQIVFYTSLVKKPSMEGSV